MEKAVPFFKTKKILKKNTILIILLLTGIIELTINSCCSDSDFDFTKIVEFDVQNSKLNEEVTDSTVVKNEEFRIQVTMGLEFITNIDSKYSSNSLYATSCENMGLEGLKDEIVNFEITCTKEILGVPQNQPLNNDDRIKVYADTFFDDTKNERISIEEWLSILNEGGIPFFHVWYFEYQEDIISSDYIQFKVKIELESGEIIEGETNHVKIE